MEQNPYMIVLIDMPSEELVSMVARLCGMLPDGSYMSSRLIPLSQKNGSAASRARLLGEDVVRAAQKNCSILITSFDSREIDHICHYSTMISVLFTDKEAPS